MKPKINYKLAFIAITLFASFLCSTAIAQPVIKVPPACEVVVAGSGFGTVLGFGGVVGSGGVITMPDQYPGDIFNYIPNGTTVTSWGMQGDLSQVTSNLPPMPPVQSAGAVLSEKIQSYNENLRMPAELAGGPLGFMNGRSKGRINVGYFSPGCGGAGISFDVYKTYNGSTGGSGSAYLPGIIGPACWEPGKTYTYSVDQIASDNLPDAIGLDEYYWTIVDATSLTVAVGMDYYSADRSSYTFTTPASFAPYTLPFTMTVCYGRANPWDGHVSSIHTSCVNLTITSVPANPVFSTPFPACVSTGVTSFLENYTPEAGCTYTWTCSNSSWTLNPGPGTLLITTMDDNPGVLTLTISGPCLPATYTETINRSFDPTVTSISGPTCVLPGSTNTYTLVSGSSVLDNVTCWNLPPGWTFTPANGDASIINVTVPPTTLPGAYPLTGFSCACPGGVINLIINIQPSAPTGITGPACVVRNGGPAVGYSCIPVLGVSTYGWIFPSGWGPCVGCSGTTPSITPGGTSPGTDFIAVVALGTGGCNSAPSLPFAVDYEPVTPASITVGCFSFGVTGNTTITVGSIPPAAFFGTYTVTSVPGGLISGPIFVDGSGVITMPTTSTASGAYTLFITHVTTSCGSSTTVSVPVTVAGNGVVLTPSCNPAPTGADLFIVSGGPGLATFTWTINGVLVPNILPFIALTTGIPAPGPICVYDTWGGCTTVACQAPCTHGYRLIQGTDGAGNVQKDFASQVTVYPNPNPGTFIVKLPAAFAGVSMHMIDATGKDIGEYTLQGGENNIPDKGFVPGIYYLVLTSDDNVAALKIEILKQ